jgi:hypothetical protein
MQQNSEYSEIFPIPYELHSVSARLMACEDFTAFSSREISAVLINNDDTM